MLPDDVYQTIKDMSLDLVDNGLQMDILQGRSVDIVIWKHTGDDWHIPYKFDKECLDFLLSINNYMISSGYTLVEVCINKGGSEPNNTFNMTTNKITIEQILKLISTSYDTVEEVSITFHNR
jgi:hypothetical protein